jgi:hypothetical protein
MAELLGGIIPRESRASCDNCAMCAVGGAGQQSAPRAYFFDPLVKCCSFVPDLPNFLVGGILSDADPAGLVETRLKSGWPVQLASRRSD